MWKTNLTPKQKYQKQEKRTTPTQDEGSDAMMSSKTFFTMGEEVEERSKAEGGVKSRR